MSSRILAILLILCALLAACTVPPTTEQTDTQPTTTTTDTTTAATTATTSGSVAEAAFPITVTHDRGEITFEKPAERIVVISEEFIELFIALDLAPVGVGVWRNEPTGDTFTQLPYLDQPIPGEPVYLNGSEPNLETLLALKPDLILHHDYADDANAKVYQSFAQIAPTLAYSGATVGGWKRPMRGLAQATGRSEQAETVIADYDARVAAVQTEMASVVAVAPAVTMLLSGIDFIGVFDERFAIGSLMQTLGFSLTTPIGDAMDVSGYTAISVELLRDIQADSIMVLRFDSEQAHISDPILATLGIPVLDIALRPGMGYTGPFAELIYLVHLGGNNHTILR